MTTGTSPLSTFIVLLALVGLNETTSRSVSISSPQDAAAPQTPAPLTPASVALLANNFDARAIEIVRTAIASEDPSVRGVAARLAGVMSAVSLTGAIWSALDREQDALAAGELARALLFLRGAAASELVESRLDRSSSIAMVYAEWLARMQPERLADLLPTLAARASGDRTELNRHVWAALDRRPDSSDRLSRSWLGATTPAAWRAFLRDIPADRTGPIPDAVLIQALNSEDSGIREATVWSMVIRLARGQPVSVAVLEGALAVEAQHAAAPDAAPTWERFGREIIARSHANRRTPDRAAFLSVEASKHVTDSPALAGIEQITEPERRALKSALGDRFKKAADVRAAAPLIRSGGAMRTIPTLVPGLLKGLVEATGCRPSGDSPLPGAALATYRADGRPGQIAVNTGLPAACEQIVTALVRLTIADAAYAPPSSAPEWLVQPLGQDYIDCTSRADHAIDEIPSMPAQDPKVEPPRKTHHVPPIYPETLRKRGVAGTVVMDSVISRSGCVAVIRVMRSADISLDYAAVHAVSGWRFTSTKLNGRDVPVMMTVTINFRLQ